MYFTTNTITFKHTHTNNKNDFGSFKTWIYLREQNFLKIFKILNATLFRRCVAWWWWYWRWSSSSFFVSWLLQLLALTFFISRLTIRYIASMYIQLIYHFYVIVILVLWLISLAAAAAAIPPCYLTHRFNMFLLMLILLLLPLGMFLVNSVVILCPFSIGSWMQDKP